MNQISRKIVDTYFVSESMTRFRERCVNVTHPNQGVRPPFSPVQVVAKQRDRERVGEELMTLQDLSQIGSVVFDGVDRFGPVVDIIIIIIIIMGERIACYNHTVKNYRNIVKKYSSLQNIVPVTRH